MGWYSRRFMTAGSMIGGVAALMITAQLWPADAWGAQRSPGSITLTGVIRDFDSGHPDFDVLDPALAGHYAHNVSTTLNGNGNPAYVGGGRQVAMEWVDKDGNPILPYGDRGLFGGHFDVDVYDAPSTKPKQHTHEFDDKYDMTYIDIANDPNLLFQSVAGSHGDLRAVFVNEHNGGGGTFTFQAGGAPVTGYTANGFDVEFSPSELTTFRVNFVSLSHLRGTEPKTSQSDSSDRDDAFAVRMYDVDTSALVYEISAYNHVGKGPPEAPAPEPAAGNDSCGDPLNDTVGAYGVAGPGAVSSDTSFDEWYADTPGVNVSAEHNVTLERGSDGAYQYSTDQFFPIDDDMLGNDSGSHNQFFTYEITAFFTYRACEGMFFEFEGNDDCWVYINGELVLDLGGVQTATKQYVALDRLGLTDQQQCKLQLFYARRRPASESIFNVRTNIELYSGALPGLSGRYD